MHADLIDNVIIFNHIPKAGGTSLTDLFREIYGPEKCFRHRARSGTNDKYSRAIGSLSDEELKQFKFLSGHFNFGNHKLISGPARYISVVRDPIDRVISDYHFNKKRGRKDRMQIAAQNSLNEYIRLKLGNPGSRLVRSSQIEYITGGNDVTQVSRIIDDHYFLCCSLRQLNEMQHLIAALAGRPDLDPVTRNVLPKSDDDKQIDPELREILTQNFALDYALIDIVESKFSEQRQAYEGALAGA